jgi:hypothetical protein
MSRNNWSIIFFSLIVSLDKAPMGPLLSLYPPMSSFPVYHIPVVFLSRYSEEPGLSHRSGGKYTVEVLLHLACDRYQISLLVGTHKEPWEECWELRK